MNSLFIMIPVTLLMLLIALAAWVWSVKSGQMDDLEREASRILFDDDLEEYSTDKTKNSGSDGDSFQ